MQNKTQFVYRGYYYDNETGYYYLQSRYYDSNICRLINSDVSEVAQNSQDIRFGTNLFAYCNNDPKNFSDPTGKSRRGFVAVGIQLELTRGSLGGGIEIIWYFSKRVNVGNRNRKKPYVYLYGAASIGANGTTKEAVRKLISRPSLLFSPSNLLKGFSFSVCVFAIWGYSNFKSPYSYTKGFKEVYGTVRHIKAYTCWSNTCIVFGLGWSTSRYSAGVSYSYYILSRDFFKGIERLYSKVYSRAKNLRG